MDKTTEEFVKNYLIKAGNKLAVAQRLFNLKDYEEFPDEAKNYLKKIGIGLP